MTWKLLFIHHLLRKSGLFYCGPEDELETEVSRHHPGILREAETLTKLVEDKIAHDGVFRPLATTGKSGV